MDLRAQKVEGLVEVAFTGMESVAPFSTDEVLSACFTLTLRLMKTAMKLDPTCRTPLQALAERLLLECADEHSLKN